MLTAVLGYDDTMAIYAITYTYDPALASTITEVRPRHREYLKSVYDAGILLASGPLGTDGALLIVRGEDAETAKAAIADDPFYEAGIITETTAQEWTPVYGPWA